MRKILVFSFVTLNILLFLNCSPKVSKKVVTESNTTTSEKIEEQKKLGIEDRDIDMSDADNTDSEWKRKSIDEKFDALGNLGAEHQDLGVEVYNSKCGSCHKLYSPSSRNAMSWIKILDKMAPKAKLNEEQQINVTAFLVNGAKK